MADADKKRSRKGQAEEPSGPEKLKTGGLMTKSEWVEATGDEFSTKRKRQKKEVVMLSGLDELGNLLGEKTDNLGMGEDTSNMSEKKKQKMEEKAEQKLKQRAIHADAKYEKVLKRCWFCYNNPNIDKHLIISLGDYSYLAVPPTAPLVPGHCLIIPNEHIIASTRMDEEVYAEIQTFKKCLVKMFNSVGKGCIFLETVTKLKSLRHTFIDCIPLKQSVMDQIPIYFKKAILESEGRWAQNVKLVDTRGKGIQRSVPPNFPYFHVEFEMDGGYAHVIEDERSFPHTFGREIVAGVLDLDVRLWKRPKKISEDLQRKI